MTPGTVLEAGMGRHSETRGTRRRNPGPRMALGHSPQHAGDCLRVAALRRCHVRRPRRPCTERTGFPAARL